MTEFAALEVVRWFLALFFPGVAAFYILRLTARRRQLGHSAVSHGALGSQPWWIAKTFVFFRTTITLVMLARAFWPGLDGYLIVCSFLMTPAVVFTGLALLVAGFAVVIALHFWMGPAWRSGLASDENLPGLITHGPFAWTRNPMFLAIQVAQAGFFLAFPSGFTLLCLVAGVAMLQLQTRLEETHLRALHGQAYRDYCERVPRWFSFRQFRSAWACRQRSLPKAGFSASDKTIAR